MNEYTSKIVNSRKELTAREAVKFKDTSNALSLDEVSKNGELEINVHNLIALEIHNEKSDNKDYPIFLVVDKDGTTYYTGSQNFFDSLTDILDTLDELNDKEDVIIKIIRKESKNYKGKQFITCALK